MTTRAFSLAFALLFAVSSAATAAPGPCCAPTESAERALVALDCCATMAVCPLRLQAAGPAVVKADGHALMAGTPAAAPESPAPVGLARSVSRSEIPESRVAGPPLYRLHAQLLI
jgi:hypothetical protein